MVFPGGQMVQNLHPQMQITGLPTGNERGMRLLYWFELVYIV